MQTSLDAKVGARRDRPTRPGGSPLTGLLFDSAGHPMTPTHSRGRSGKPHRYYVSKVILTGRRHEAGMVPRIPAKAIEALMRDRLAKLLPEGVSWEWAEARKLIDRIIVRDADIKLDLSDQLPAEMSKEAERRLAAGDRIVVENERISLLISAHLNSRSGRTILLGQDGRLAADDGEPDQTLIGAIARAHAWRKQLVSGAAASVAVIASEKGCTPGAVHHLLPLAYLAPDLTRAILAGSQRPGLSLELLVRGEYPLSWSAQRRLFGLDSAD